MSGQNNRREPDTGFEQNSKTAEQAAAGALLARLAALETDAAPLSEERQAALYRRAMEKAGLAGQSAAGDIGDAAGTEDPAAAETASPKKKLIRWQRWALSAAAALAVMVLGAAALVSGGFRMHTGMAEAQYSTEAAMDTAAPEPRETAPKAAEEDSPAEVTMDSLTADHAAGIAESNAPDTDAAVDEKTTEEPIAEEPTVNEPVSGGETGETGETVPPEEPTEDSVAECLPEEEIIGTDSTPNTAADGSGAELLLLVNGRLYRGTALVLEPSVSSTERLARIATTVAAEELPAAEGQANFDAAGAPYLYWRSGLAVLLDGEWRFFEPVE